MSSFLLLRPRWVKREIKRLRLDQATGPDGIPARILVELGIILALPLTLLFRKIIRSGIWPQIWKFHQICPLYKKGATYHAGNYRGLNLTPILSKLAERILNYPLQKFLISTNAFGTHQWAFQQRRGCANLILLLFCRWLLAFKRREKVDVFLSDISGAFDRVNSEKMQQKLGQSGVSRDFLNFFRNYLKPRVASVVVEGTQSEELVLENMIFQGTVLGPELWNVFFAKEECQR